MSLYLNSDKNAAIASLEYQAGQGGGLFFITLRDASPAQEIISHLAKMGTGIALLSQATHEGKTVLVFSGAMEEKQVLEGIRSSGAPLHLATNTASVNPWVIRSLLGLAGQTLQLISAFLRPPTPGKTRLQNVDRSTFLFASSNLTANAINLVYKEQNTDDPHQLAHLKLQTSNLLREYSADPSQPILSKLPETPTGEKGGAKTTSEKSHSFMERYSVNIGELGLRFLGALGLAGNSRLWNGQEKSQGKLFSWNSSPLKRYAGTSSIIGKTIALGSTIPDPFNPAPKSWLESAREKWTFLVGGWIEVTSFAALAYDNFMNSKPGTAGEKHGMQLFGKKYRDWLGGLGASLFVCGYIVRSWAQFGKRNLNMEALYDHISDHLAAMPAEKIPDLAAQTSLMLEEHFAKNKAQAHSLGELFQGTIQALHKRHGIVVSNDFLPRVMDAASVPSPKKPTVTGPEPSSAVAEIQAHGMLGAPKGAALVV